MREGRREGGAGGGGGYWKQSISDQRKRRYHGRRGRVISDAGRATRKWRINRRYSRIGGTSMFNECILHAIEAARAPSANLEHSLSTIWKVSTK